VSKKEVDAMAKAAGESEEAAKAKLKTCTDFIVEHKVALRTVLPNQGAGGAAAVAKAVAKPDAAAKKDGEAEGNPTVTV